MGKFDGFLICSDVDGTFRAGGDTESVNSEAVKYFTENGGRFTFATGRMIGNLKQSGIASVINAPMCVCNGGIIYDAFEDKVIFERHLDFCVRDFHTIIKDFENATVFIFRSADDESSFDVTIPKIPELSEEMLSVNPIKLVCKFDTTEEADEFKAFAQSNPFFKNSLVCKSWAVGVEICPASATKGDAIRFIKDYLGNIHTTIGVGDYENDITLIKDADIGVAVGNALECVKKEADLVIKPASEYAIRDLIQIIEKKMV